MKDHLARKASVCVDRRRKSCNPAFVIPHSQVLAAIEAKKKRRTNGLDRLDSGKSTADLPLFLVPYSRRILALILAGNATRQRSEGNKDLENMGQSTKNRTEKR